MLVVRLLGSWSVRSFVVLCCLAIFGCKGSFSKDQAKVDPGTLRYCMANNPASLDPAMAQDLDTIRLMSQTYEGLVDWGEDNRIHPLLAESYQVTDGGRGYVFKLRKDVHFQNGRALEAADFKWTLERNCSPKLSSPIAKNYLGDILGARDMIDGKVTTLSGVQVLDPLTLKITIDKPRAYFIGKLTYPVASVIAHEADSDGSEIRSPAQAVGTGAFKLTGYTPDQNVQLEAFEKYHGGAPPTKKLEIAILKDSATRLDQYKAGQLDFLTLDLPDVYGVKADANLRGQLHSYDRAGLVYLGLNQGAYPPFKDVRVRRAFAMAINRSRIAARDLAGLETFATGILPPSLPGYRKSTAVIPFSYRGAKKALLDAGFDPSKMPPLSLLTTAQSPDRQLVADSVATQLRMALGVDVKVQTLEMGAFLHFATQKKAPFFLGSWFADYLDPENFLSVTLASYGQDRVSYNSARFSELCEKADAESDTKKRMQEYAQAEDMALQDAVWIPLYYPRDNILISPKVTGLRNNAFGLLPHTEVKKG